MIALTLCAYLLSAPRAAADAAPPSVPIVFDTDMGNDIDDALALSCLHALADRGECRLLAVTLTKDHADAGPFCDVLDTFHGRPDVPIGVVKGGKTPDPGKYLSPIVHADDGGKPRYPHDLTNGAAAPDATTLLRKTLANEPDRSVVCVQVGFSTNLARLLDSMPDAASKLAGRELVEKKCRLLVVMAGMFSPDRKPEYNVYTDAPAARKVFADWPTPIVASGYEIGRAIQYPAASIENDFRYVRWHPTAEAYRLYQKMPYDRETWDLTAVLYAVRPDRGYFSLSPPGEISVDERNVTQFRETPDGKCRFLLANASQIERVREALVQLASQPPRCPSAREQTGGQ